MCMFEITSDARIRFQMVSWATLPVVVRHRQLSQGLRWWRHNLWRTTQNNTEPNSIWFPAMLTDTDLNIQGIQVKYYKNGNWTILATESRLWGTKWYYLFSAQVRMLRRWAFRIFYTTIFNWTFKNCVSRRGSSKGYCKVCPWPIIRVSKCSSKFEVLHRKAQCLADVTQIAKAFRLMLFR